MRADDLAAVEEVVVTTNSGWRFRPASPGTVYFQRTTWFDDLVRVADTTGPLWIMASAEISQGTAIFFHGQERVRLPPKFGLYLPPFSILEGEYLSVHKLMRGIICFSRPPAALPAVPTIFVPGAAELPEGPEAAEEFFLAGSGHRPVSRLVSPSALVGRAKREIDRSFSSQVTMAEISRKLKTSSARLAREFKREAGLSPVAYRSQMRVMWAALQLLQKREILAACADSGFSDLSQFYRQFKKHTTVTPAAYRIKSKKSKK